jgi:hypothetical protein
MRVPRMTEQQTTTPSGSIVKLWGSVGKPPRISFHLAAETTDPEMADLIRRALEGWRRLRDGLAEPIGPDPGYETRPERMEPEPEPPFPIGRPVPDPDVPNIFEGDASSGSVL